MPDDVTIIIEGGEDETEHTALAESGASSPDPASVEAAEETANALAGPPNHTAEEALAVAETALIVAATTGAEIEAERERTWQDNIASGLAEINRKLDSLMTPPAPPAPPEPEPEPMTPELEIAEPPTATEGERDPLFQAGKGRKRRIGLKL